MKTNIINRLAVNMAHRFINAPLGLFGLAAILAIAGLPSVSRASNDLIVNGTTQTIPTGNYNTVIVENSGSLTVNGTLTAQTLILVAAGTLNVSSNLVADSASIDGTVNVTGEAAIPSVLVLYGTTTVAGNLTSSNLTVKGGLMQVYGTSNSVDSVTISGQLSGLGTWQINSLLVATGGVFSVVANNTSLPQSGLLFIHGNTVHIETGGMIYGTGAGNDPRGKGHDWYSNCSGGGHGGSGGRGYWDSSGGGNEGQAFGYAYTYETFMGGAGGYYGGGGVTVEAEVSLTLDGDIISDGVTSYNGQVAGGAGGGILIRSPVITLNGILSAKGGHGNYCSGGGGGGRIKVFYGNQSLGSLVDKTSVTGGNAGGYRNTQPGQTGTVYRDFIPQVQSFISPPDGVVVTNGSFTFKFVIEDFSQALDGRTETLTPVIELSRDGFKTIAYSFNHDLEIAGWNQALYYSGDLAVFTPQTMIAAGVYEWRVTVRDGSLLSRYSSPRTLAVETILPINSIGINLQTIVVPRVIIKSGIGTLCRIEYADSLSPAGSWSYLSDIRIISSPQYYLDLSGYGKPNRFYRVRQLP